MGDDRRLLHRRGTIGRCVERFSRAVDRFSVHMDVTAVSDSMDKELLLFLFNWDCAK